MLHLITCHGRIMPRLAELLLHMMSIVAGEEKSQFFQFFAYYFEYHPFHGECHAKLQPKQNIPFVSFVLQSVGQTLPQTQ